MPAAIADPAAIDVADLESQLRALNANAAARSSSQGRSGIDWRLAIDTSNDAFVSVDASGVIHEWNARAEALFGWPRQEVLGRRLSETIFPEQASRGGGLQQITRAGHEGKRLEVIARRRDGRELPAEVSMSMMQRGGAIMFNAFIHDISARRELQAQLAHGQKLESIGQLSAGIAHEINTPTQYVGDNTRFVRDALADVFGVLDAYATLADLVRGGGDARQALPALDRAIEAADLGYLTGELTDAVDQSLEGIERVASIVRAMKEFSHPGSATKTPTNLGDAIAATITVATNEWKYVASVETDFDPAMPLVPCLPGDFNQVILNIIVNAAHAIGEKLGRGGEKGLISVSTRVEQAWAVVRIADTGTGIPEEVLTRIFDPFYTTKDVGVGTGQGLAISRSVIVDKHGGTLDVESQVGEGAIFTIRLPIGSETHSGAAL
ncbi:MAG: ATP-binding protein [Planctomycetota bacterium]